MTRSDEEKLLHIGERVRVYSFTGSASGTIESNQRSIDGHVRVKFDEEFDFGDEIRGDTAWAHPKQCRRLRPRGSADEYVIVSEGEYYMSPGDGVTRDLCAAHVYTKETAEACSKDYDAVVIPLAEAKKREGRT